MSKIGQDRLVRKEVALGFIREQKFPENHIGLSLIAPFMDVESDDVIFQYVQEPAAGLAPARAEDAESELAGKEDTLGEGRASIVDWAIKDHYNVSDVSRYQDSAYIAGQLGDALPMSQRNVIESFNKRVARDTVIRRRKLDNRIEKLIMDALFTGAISYNDGKVIFEVNYGRPTDTQEEVASAGAGEPWTSASSDPIEDILVVQDFMRDTYGVKMDRAIASRKIIRNILNSDKFAARSGLAGSSGPSGAKIDPKYLIDGWGVEAALAVVERATGVKFIEYDAVYTTRAAASKTLTRTRFTNEDQVVFLPAAADVAELDDNIGFAKTLTSPHPEGNWTSGYYEWEKDTGPDPWGHDMGAGIKAFPVFPHMDLTFRLDVIN